MTKRQREDAAVIAKLETEMIKGGYMPDEKTVDPQKVKLTDVRLFFPKLFTPEAFKNEEGKEKNYQARFGILKDSPLMKIVQAAIIATAKAKWNDKAELVIKQLRAENKICVYDGDVKTTEGFAGNFVISANRKQKEGRPLLLDRSRNVLAEDTGVLYSGCYVNAVVRFWAQDNGWGKRINASLHGVQFFKAGEAFSGGGTTSVDEFDAAPDETVGGGSDSMFD
jgi:hypothetical protein